MLFSTAIAKMNERESEKSGTKGAVVIEVQIKNMADDLDELKQSLQQEINSRVTLQNKFQDLVNQLSVN